MDDTGNTFTVEIIGFPGLTPEEAAEALAAPLGITAAAAAEHIARLPAIVKTRVPAAGVQTLTKNLLGAGADVRLTHEASGQAKVYEAKSIAAEKARAQMSIPPGPRRPVEARQEAESSERCISCRFEVPPDKQTCPRCGWNATSRQRRCTKCDGEIGSGTARLVKSPAVASTTGGVLSVAVAAASFWLGYRYGFRVAGAAFTAYLAVALGFIAVLLDLRCHECHEIPSKAFLSSGEKTGLLARRLSLAGGALVSILVAAALGYPYLSTASFELASDRSTYTARLPWSHHDIEEDTIRVNTPLGRMEAETLSAINEREKIALFAMFYFEIPETIEIEDEEQEWELLRYTLEGSVKNVGCEMSTTNDMIHYGAPGLEGTFSGAYQDESISGRARVYLFKGEIVMLLYAGQGSEVVEYKTGIAFFDSFKSEQGTGEDKSTSR